MVEILAWNWTAFATCYVFVWLMELLDNTQLIQVYYSSKYGRQWVLALASWTAFLCTGLIGASFSGLRSFSDSISKVFELVFSLILFTLGIITLSHSEVIVAVWEKITGFIQHKFAEPFLYSMGETDTSHTQLEETNDVEMESPEAAEKEKEKGKEKDSEQGDIEEQADKDKEKETVKENTKPDMAERRMHIPIWKLFILVFVTVFLLELPDKTMLMIASLAQSSDYPTSIFVGYSAAMVTQSVIALIIGKGISKGANRFGKYIEVMVGLILFITGTTKLSLMIFVGEYSLDDIFGHDSSSSAFNMSLSIAASALTQSFSSHS
ncbi:hypothetical protein Pelo_12466 [Pelomyxa schiedti]|nr:hypothetical protein Pelo_12466 [Pelomyxa schiedti]